MEQSALGNKVQEIILPFSFIWHGICIIIQLLYYTLWWENWSFFYVILSVIHIVPMPCSGGNGLPCTVSGQFKYTFICMYNCIKCHMSSKYNVTFAH